MIRELTTAWRTQHLAGKLIPCRWDVQPVYTMVDADVWDDPCRKLLDDLLNDDEALDAFTLMLYGGPFATHRSMVGKMCNIDDYLERASLRLSKASDMDKSVKAALQKAVGRGAYA